MIEVQDLTRYYGRFAAVRDVSFEVGEHVVVGLLGLNGAGKSTILKVLGGLLLPSAGSVKIKGVDVSASDDALRKRIGFLPEEPPLYREMRVEDFLRWCGEVKGVRGERLSARLEEVVRLCDLGAVRQKLIHNLSHGYRKRVGIAQAIIHEPDLVILDEPISGLDPVQIVEMRKVLRSLRESCTVLVSSHILSEISQTCDRILVIHQGRLVAQGAEDELFAGIEGGTRVQLTVRAEREAFEAFVSEHPAVGEVDIVAEHDALLQASLVLAGDTREQLVADLVAQGFGLRRLEEGAAELEQVFLGLTQLDGAVRSGSGTEDGDVDVADNGAAKEAAS